MARLEGRQGRGVSLQFTEIYDISNQLETNGAKMLILYCAKMFLYTLSTMKRKGKRKERKNRNWRKISYHPSTGNLSPGRSGFVSGARTQVVSKATHTSRYLVETSQMSIN